MHGRQTGQACVDAKKDKSAWMPKKSQTCMDPKRAKLAWTPKAPKG
jgi:hypothetical protein